MRMYSRLFIFVEGSTDREFFEKIVVPMFQERYDYVKVEEWAQERKDKINSYIKTIGSGNRNANYIFVTDMDKPCVSAQKETIKKRYKNVDESKILVVCKEIESWYLALLNDDRCEELGISRLHTTDDVTKERFQELTPKKFGSEVDFMREILRTADIETAKRKNKSFRYFVKEYGL